MITPRTNQRRPAMRARAFSSVSLLALSCGLLCLAPVGAMAQTAPASAAEASADTAELSRVEEIVISASRINREGFTAPTPTTVLGDLDFKQSVFSNVGAVLNDFPSFRPSETPVTSSANTGSGLTQADLRGLGPSRTLVLVDGRRQVPTTRTGFNLNMIPFSLVERVEVVTGGASAAWGSGAVAGVVNIILDKDFDGLKADVQYGVSSRGDGSEYKAGVAYGTAFANDRGHISFAAEYVDNQGIRPKTSRDWYGKWALLANPGYTPTNGQSRFVIAPNVNFSAASLGGLIVSGPLAGNQFGPNGTLIPFNYGSYRGPAFMSGGDGVSHDEYTALTAPVTRKNAFGRGSYDLTEDTKVFTELTYSESTSSSDFWPETDLGSLVIKADNGFLPQNVRDQMTSLGLTQLNVGRVHADFGSFHNDVSYKTIQTMAGFEGKLGDNWSWEAYYSYGQSKHNTRLSNLRIASKFAQSLDSVINPATGAVVCRSTLTNPGDGCVPLNIFGPNAASKQAVAYFTGAAWVNSTLAQHVVSGSIQGEPFSTWAGPVSFATGAEWRSEEIENVTDPLSATKSFRLINFAPLKGDFNVKEAFAETVIPLAADLPFAKSLELNGAVRVSDYSTSGKFTSWKIGLSHQVFDDLRLRATRSRDLRAPTLSELFLGSQLNLVTISDPFTNVQSEVRQITRGSTDLKPESAYTTTLGAIYAPSWFDGLRFSVDYYSIKIGGAITTVTAQDVVSRCFSGNAALCSLISRGASGIIETVDAPYVNLSKYETSGVDIEMAYATPLSAISENLPGDLDLRVVASYVGKLVTDDGITRRDLLGELGSNVTGTPRWRWTASATYDLERWSFTSKLRYVGGGKYNSQFDIDDNTVGDRLYVDAGLEHSLGIGDGDNAKLYVNVRNLFDKNPPKLPNPVHFDVIGRYITAGLRIQY